MKSLSEHISQVKDLHSLNEYILEKLIVNKNYHVDNYVNFEDKNLKNVYLIRFRPHQELIYVSIIDVVEIVNFVDKPDRKKFEVTGQFMFGTTKYTKSQFMLDPHGFLYRYSSAFEQYFDILLHPYNLEGFKNFVKSFSDTDEISITYHVEEVLDTLGIECDNIPKEFYNIEYGILNTENPTKLELLKNYLKIK